MQSVSILKILETGTDKDKKALFQFNTQSSDDEVILKFNLWSRYFFSKYFKVKDAWFHDKMDRGNLAVYRGSKKELLNSGYRKSAKTTRTKLFIAFCIANDEDKICKYIKFLSHDRGNSKKFVTDVYNMLVTINSMYPEIFAKTTTKREETMTGFTTSTSVRMESETVGVEQRGAVIEDSRPDLQIFDDFETRKTLRSAIITKDIWDNMEEARNGGAKPGEGCIYLFNYISELGNVHKLMERASNEYSIIINVAIINDDGVISWPEAQTMEDIEFLKSTAEDWEGEFLNKPSASKDVYFPRDLLETQEIKEPLKNVGGLKIYKDYSASHLYGGGADVAGGVGLDSSTAIFINFSTFPAQVVGVYYSNEIAPEAFGDTLYEFSTLFGTCILGIENNKFDQTVLKAKQRGANLYVSTPKANKIKSTRPTQWGWNTNSLTKPKMLADLKTAIEDGLLALNDKNLIKEVMSYTRNDLIDKDPDIRLTTRHLDLVIALAIAWQMKDYATKTNEALDDYYSNLPVSKTGAFRA